VFRDQVIQKLAHQSQDQYLQTHLVWVDSHLVGVVLGLLPWRAGLQVLHEQQTLWSLQQAVCLL
jgi:hypothetical protein